jgi:acetyl esterase
MPDYTRLIDAETWAFIERTNSYYPPDTVDYTLAEQRQIYDRMCREFHAGHPEGVTAEDSAILTPERAIPIRIYRFAPEAPAVVLYFHGGGFILGGLESHDDVSAELCARTGFEVVSVDYRLAPEHLHPASFDDALAAFEWAAATCDRPVLLCGDSAGGNLAAAVAQACRDGGPHLAAQFLVYPATDLLGRYGVAAENARYPSRQENAEGYFLTGDAMRFFAGHYLPRPQDSEDPRASPLRRDKLAGVARAVICTAEFDPLRDEGEAYADALKRAGVEVAYFREPGMVHGYFGMGAASPAAEAARQRATAAFKAMLSQ